MSTITEYIESFPADIQKKLVQVYAIIQKIAPDSEESISYGMPAFKLNKKPLVYFAAYPKHIGFYATPTGHSQFAEELSQYKQGKGSVQFPHNKELPIGLIERIVEFRVNENRSSKN